MFTVHATKVLLYTMVTGDNIYIGAKFMKRGFLLLSAVIIQYTTHFSIDNQVYTNCFFVLLLFALFGDRYQGMDQVLF